MWLSNHSHCALQHFELPLWLHNYTATQKSVKLRHWRHPAERWWHASQIAVRAPAIVTSQSLNGNTWLHFTVRKNDHSNEKKHISITPHVWWPIHQLWLKYVKLMVVQHLQLASTGFFRGKAPRIGRQQLAGESQAVSQVPGAWTQQPASWQAAMAWCSLQTASPNVLISST